MTGIMPVTRGRLALPKCPEDCPADIFELIKDCTAHDPDDRPTAKECFERMKVGLCPATASLSLQHIPRYNHAHCLNSIPDVAHACQGAAHGTAARSAAILNHA